MKIRKILDLLESQGEWVNRNCTRDRILFGDDQKDVDKVIVCWVATNDIIDQAIEQDVHFIITHENAFYMASTSLPTPVYEAQQKKEILLKENDITLYRCHDLWDLYPEYGVRDCWAKVLELNFEAVEGHSFLRYAHDVNMTVKELAHHINERIEPYYQYGIEVIGNLDKKVNRLGIGTGACTDVFEMSTHDVDACLVSDDGINNWIAVQWAMDHDLPLLVINHMTCEAPGIKCLADYLNKELPEVSFTYLPNTYGIHHIEK